MINLLVILLSVLLQIAAAAFAIRVNRIAGRRLVWLLLSGALVLMAVRRLMVLEDLVNRGLPDHLLSYEVLGLLISAMLLAGMILVQDVFRSKAVEAARLEEARIQARAEADKLTAVMAATPIPLWISEDPACQLVHANPAASRLHLMAPATRQAQGFILRQNGRDLALDEMPLQRAARAGEQIHDLPLDLVSPDGEVRRLMFYATPLRDLEGRLHGGVCCAVDITDSRRTEEALSKAQKMESLGMLSGGIAHDFNNIFQSMTANLEMAQASVPEDSKSQGYLLRLKAGLDRASRLSRDILYSSGGDLRRPESLTLGPLVAEALDRMGLPVLRDLTGDLPVILVDPLLVSRVVEGLVTNALEADSAMGAIRVRTYMRTLTATDLSSGHWPEAIEPGLYAVLEVSDQGHGIDGAMLSRIFDPFFSTRDLGRGLGLAAALGIVRGHRGGIQVESIPDVGSVFRVHFPAPEGQVPTAAPTVVDLHARNVVLLADDELDLREVMAEMLQDWFGLEVVSAADGQEALEVFTQRPEAFDLVILDATMPRMGGVEAFRAMQALRPGLPGILCSGYALPVSRDQAIAQGFADFLKKPFTSAELEVLLDRVMGARLK
ncbi:MAG: response regulator [Geothrix sp.]|uniref:hybrid sensor histidine kinase/response regulator n=1 Tax=Geothrix sp. TaxID=1962974 RepID=UPI00183AF404|nr:PAS domain-containing hybrid sensor histidine kinase/response regulator [Geothrix sp.]NWJ42095.1 response regulator [Geothrix sp.]WIL19937.1 MAG: response regulator [Geothrix sp.]